MIDEVKGSEENGSMWWAKKEDPKIRWTKESASLFVSSRVAGHKKQKLVSLKSSDKKDEGVINRLETSETTELTL